MARAAEAARGARERLEAAGYEVQTLRLAVSAGGANRCGDFTTIARGIEEAALDAGFDCVSLGPQAGERLAALPKAIAATGMLFAAAPLTGPDGAIYPDMVRAAAEAIVATGAATPGGLGNMRFAALAGVAPGSPFFPAAYHDGGAPWIAVGPEAAALAFEATQALSSSRMQTINRGERRDREDSEEQRHDTQLSASSAVSQAALARLTMSIEEHDARITAALDGLEAETGVRFAGCDWSLAPYPSDGRGIGTAIEALSGVPFGAWGTLAAVRALTAAIRAAPVSRLGFSGVMLPVLEDLVLARRNAEGHYTLRDLLAFSAVCGTGLDTIPLPGDTTARQIAGVLHEVAALSSALGKPLTARLLPLPGLKAGDMTNFELLDDPQLAQYLCATRVMQI
jgi:uncharacterized protein (UPF0210 family)